MKFMNGITELECGKTAVTLGKFDGMHIGHQKLIRKILGRQKEGFESLVFTFDLSSRAFFSVEQESVQVQKTLLTKEERKNLLSEWGVAYVMECPFTEELMEMQAEDFVQKIICEKLHAAYVVVGSDFHFGNRRQGDVNLLQMMAAQGRFQLDVVNKELVGDTVISSTMIRQLLQEGNIEKANLTLGYPFRIENSIVYGNKLGRTWGIPTINMEVEEQKLLPPNGVYFTITRIGKEWYYGITNIGNKPTIDAHARKKGMRNGLGNGYAKGVETHLFLCEKELYGQMAQVCLLHFHRPEQRFDNLDQLIEQIKQDILCAKRYFKEFPVSSILKNFLLTFD